MFVLDNEKETERQSLYEKVGWVKVGVCMMYEKS